MKRNIIAIAALVVLCGCTTTNVETDTWKMSRKSFLQKVEMPKVTIQADGSASLEGYTNDGGTELTAQVVGAAVGAAVSALK